ncbi:MAG: hypothetical protein AAF386_09315, partial [Pseudomonadota bacterium]
LAEQYLDSAFEAAENLARRNQNDYDYRQLNSRRISFMLLRDQKQTPKPIETLKKVIPLATSLFIREDVHRGAYNTLDEIAGYLDLNSNQLPFDLRRVFYSGLQQTQTKAVGKIPFLEHFTRDIAIQHCDTLSKALDRLKV